MRASVDEPAVGVVKKRNSRCVAQSRSAARHPSSSSVEPRPPPARTSASYVPSSLCAFSCPGPHPRVVVDAACETREVNRRVSSCSCRGPIVTSTSKKDQHPREAGSTYLGRRLGPERLVLGLDGRSGRSTESSLASGNLGGVGQA